MVLFLFYSREHDDERWTGFASKMKSEKQHNNFPTLEHKGNKNLYDNNDTKRNKLTFKLEIEKQQHFLHYFSGNLFVP